MDPDKLRSFKFKREQFKTLIKNTYDQYFENRMVRWDINEFLDVVDQSKLEYELGPYLEQNETNKITLQNMPELDLGDRPSTYNKRSQESEQNFLIPSSIYPNHVVVRYQHWKPKF